MGWVSYLLTSAGFGRLKSSDENQDNMYMYMHALEAVLLHIWYEMSWLILVDSRVTQLLRLCAY